MPVLFTMISLASVWHIGSTTKIVWINEPGKSTKVWVGKWDAEAGERRGTHGSLRWDASSLDMGEKSFL